MNYKICNYCFHEYLVNKSNFVIDLCAEHFWIDNCYSTITYLETFCIKCFKENLNSNLKQKMKLINVNDLSKETLPKGYLGFCLNCSKDVSEDSFAGIVFSSEVYSNALLSPIPICAFCENCYIKCFGSDNIKNKIKLGKTAATMCAKRTKNINEDKFINRRLCQKT